MALAKAKMLPETARNAATRIALLLTIVAARLPGAATLVHGG